MKEDAEEYPDISIPETDLRVMTIINQEKMNAYLKTIIVLQCKILSNGDNDKAIDLTSKSIAGVKQILERKGRQLIKKYPKG
jgi:hypothetical protein